MKKHKFFIIVGVLVLVLASIFIAISLGYKNKFLPNTVINEVSVSNESVKEAEQKITDAQPEYIFTLVSNKQDWDTISGTELGITFNYEEGLEKLLSEQNIWSWITCYLRSPKEQTISNSSIDETTFSSSQEELKNKLTTENESRTKTTNATISLQNASYTIVPETQGTELNVDALIKEFDTDVKEGKTSLDMDSYIIKPTVTSDDATLKTNLKKIEKLSSQSISYLINGNTVTIPSDTIKSWIQYSDGDISVDSDAIYSYVTELGNKYNTSSNNLEFNSTSRGTVSIPPGSYNWTIQTQTETNELSAIVLSGEGASGRTPAYQGSGNPSSPLVGTTYIEVDLQKQHMWYYKDGNVVIETDVITGKPSTPTPTGVFYVWNKELNATLVGEDYKTPVDHWMPIDWTGVGIHDSPWQSAYGGTLYTTVGSHGCINTPPAVVSQLYDAVSVGTPVLVF